MSYNVNKETLQKYTVLKFAISAVSGKTDTKWNSSTFCGSASQKVEQGLKADHCSKKRGTVTQIVEQLLLKVYNKQER